MPTFNNADTLNLTLDSDDTVTFNGVADITATPVGSSFGQTSRSYGAQTIGPFGRPTTLSIACLSAGSYTQNSGYVSGDHGAQHLAMRPPNGTCVVLAQGAVPSGIACTGSVAANGALTLGTALPTTYNGGIWLYFPAGAAYAGSVAGNYWCVMSSTTAGTIYNTLLGASWPTIPANPTPIVAAGPGAYTGSTAEITLATVTVPGGMIGQNGRLRWSLKTTQNNSANAKTSGTKLGGTGWSYGIITSVSFSATISMANRGLANNVWPRTNVVEGAAGATISGDFTTINTAIDQIAAFTGTCAAGAGADYVILESALVEVLPS